MIRLGFVLFLASAAVAQAQSWAELNTLVFSPVGPIQELPLAEAFAGSENRLAGDESQILDQVVALNSRISAAEATYGMNAPELVDDLLLLAEAHQALGDHGDALIVLERAQHLVRINHGLYSLRQVEAVEKIISSLAADDELFDTLPFEAHLQELVVRNPGDPRSVDVLTEIADRQMQTAGHYLKNGLPPIFGMSMQSGMPSIGGRRSDPPTAKQLARRNLFLARRNYSSAVYSAMETGTHDFVELFELQNRIVDTLYFEKMHPELFGGRTVRSIHSPLARLGLRVLNAQLANSRELPGTPEAIGRVLVEIADWKLLFAAHGRALDLYRDARAELVDGGVEPSVIEDLLSPSVPVALPSFAVRFGEMAAGSEVSGWFDIDIDVNRYGRVVSAEVVDRSERATNAIAKRIRRHVLAQRFRPRFQGGQPRTRDQFLMRFHFAYERLPN